LISCQCGWKETFLDFIDAVKNLNAKELTSLGPAFKKSFDLLNQFRLQRGIDNYAQVTSKLHFIDI
jgi:hypothetical protein